jgi:hypothetical protein
VWGKCRLPPPTSILRFCCFRVICSITGLTLEHGGRGGTVQPAWWASRRPLAAVFRLPRGPKACLESRQTAIHHQHILETLKWKFRLDLVEITGSTGGHHGRYGVGLLGATYPHHRMDPRSSCAALLSRRSQPSIISSMALRLGLFPFPPFLPFYTLLLLCTQYIDTF